MSECFAEGLIKFDTKATKPLQQYFVADSPAQLDLRSQLYNINMLLKPISRGLKSLESSQVTCSDVFNIWIGIAIGFKEVFSNPDNQINKYRQETFNCYNNRFAIFMNDFYYRDGALRLALPPRHNFSRQTASPLVDYLMKSAREMFRCEQFRHRNGTEAEAAILTKQLIAYMYREAPFDRPCNDMGMQLSWWKSVAKDSNAYLLAACCLIRIGIKLASTVPSEMPDERTASKLTAMSTAARNNLGALNLVRCAVYGFGSTEVKQHCQKVRLELPTSNRKPSDPIVAGVPTLRNLLNAESFDNRHIDEEALFNHPDPYGVRDYEAMEEGEDEKDTAPPPLVVRLANLPTLDIEAYIDLGAPKLTERFAPDQGTTQQNPIQPPKKPAKASNAEWTSKDAEWDAADW
ncbi:hypothetical protein C8R43DRAFT_1103347 [Mycena crocata]|nr:hypothetical protein C8R43DRAFT_1103347 [Mycena crocata]